MIFCSVLRQRKLCSQASEDFLNFLAGCSYKASREKAHLCQQSVRYLGLIVSEGTRAIGPERIEPILNHPLPMTLRQLRGFLRIIGYCLIWIPGYGELTRLLYKLITEIQQAQTDKLFWSPDSQKAISALNAEQVQIRKVVLQNRLALDILTAAQGETCAIIHTPCCRYIPDMNTNVTHFTKHMTKMIGAMATPEASIASPWEMLTSSPW